MAGNLREFTQLRSQSVHNITAKRHAIFEQLLANAQYLNQPNFNVVHPADLELLFELYDGDFFGHKLRDTLDGREIDFRFSKRMTSSGGKTTYYRPRSGDDPPWFEITISSALLFDAFNADDHRPIVVTGGVCQNRLEALLRIFEHELIHLAETLVWQTSSCTGGRFQRMAENLFGHTEHAHRLITRKERALVKHGLRGGSRVRFRFDGVEYTGVINRITKRATVLVESHNGRLYSDGKRYSKFYVPIGMLEAVD